MGSVTAREGRVETILVDDILTVIRIVETMFD